MNGDLKNINSTGFTDSEENIHYNYIDKNAQKKLEMLKKELEILIKRVELLESEIENLRKE